jgi:sulfur carrier protein ThiS
VLAQVFAAQPQARGYVLDEQGQLRKHIAVFVDGRRVRDRERLSDPVGEASEIYVLQALTGG